MRAALIGAAALTTAVAGVAAAMPSHVTAFTLAELRLGGQTPVTTLASYGARGTDVVTYQHGASLTMVADVRNDGPLAATVTGLDLGGERLPLLSVRSGVADTELAPGQSRRFEVRLQLDNCRYYHEREVSTYDNLRVHFRVVGGTGTRLVRLARPLVVHSPMIVGCPDRKLDRTADNRTNR